MQNNKKPQIKKIFFSLRKRYRFFISLVSLFLSKKKKEKGFLFVLEGCETSGGIEKRVQQYAVVWRQLGYKVYYAAIRDNSLKGVDLVLSKNKKFNNLLLRLFCKHKNIFALEWQAGGAKIPPFDFRSLIRQNILVGVVIHAVREQWNLNYLSDVHYVFCISKEMEKRVPMLKIFPVFPNAVFNRKAVWCFCNQKKAIFISRLSKDKLPSIESFIQLCISVNLQFDIAGGGPESPQVEKFLMEKYSLKQEYFIGEVETEKFLIKKWKEYLFVGGIGQVILEAGMLGYPCMVCSLVGLESSFFVTNDNFVDAYETNFSPKLSFYLRKLQSSSNNLLKDYKRINKGNINPFNISEKIKKKANLPTILKRYEEFILNKIRGAKR